MKKFAAIMITAAMLLSAAGCGKKITSGFGSQTDSLYLYKNLAITDVYFDDFDTSKYDAEEFKGILEGEVQTYADAHGYEVRYNEKGEVDESVTASLALQKCEAYDGIIEIRLQYSSAEDYVAFNSYELEEKGGSRLETGLLSEAPEEVTGAAYVNGDGSIVDVQEIINKGKGADYRYLICDFSAHVYGDGEAYAMTAAGIYDAKENSVSVPAGETVIVIFK